MTLKYSVGLDISAKDIHGCLSVIDSVQKVSVKASRKFENSKSGFVALNDWIQKGHKEKELPLVVNMEATGAYYENCAIYLHQEKYAVTVTLPNIAKKYLQSLGLKSKNDKIDALGLSRMGAEQCLEAWKPLSEYNYQLRCLTRQHQAMTEQKICASNQQHADEHGMYMNELVMSLHVSIIAYYDTQLAALAKAIDAHIATDVEVCQKVNNICKIKGIGTLTVAVLIAETNGFASFKNVPQLVSYAGYDVIENQSGDHRGKTKISKKGNSHIRRILHFPAFNMITHEQKPFLDLFIRVFEKNKIKMKGYVAVQKKLLVIIFGLYKRNEAYDITHRNSHTKEKELVPPLGTIAKAA